MWGYVIFAALLLTLLWGYHRIMYSISTYEKFEYYLSGETCIMELVMVWEILLAVAAVLVIIYLGGNVVNKLIK